MAIVLLEMLLGIALRDEEPLFKTLLRRL